MNPRGIDGAHLAELADGVTLSTSVSGTGAFGATTDPTYAFDVLIDLRDALLADDADGAAATLDQLATVIERINSPTTEVGTRLGWISRLEARLDEGVWSMRLGVPDRGPRRGQGRPGVPAGADRVRGRPLVQLPALAPLARGLPPVRAMHSEAQPKASRANASENARSAQRRPSP